ncbi:MAG TPA: S53 family peptidase [Pseudonocardiaceae bacterium]
MAAGLSATLVALGVLAVPAAAGTDAAHAPAKHNFSAAARQVGAQTTAQGRAKAMEQVLAAEGAVRGHANASMADAATLFPRATAYGAPTEWNNGITGAGATVAVIDSFGDPNIGQVMSTFDTDEGLPPAQVSQLQPAGAVPSCASLKSSNPTAYNDCLGWAGETDLDVESVHELAPGASIIIAATPVDETEGMTGLPEMMTAIDYLRTHKLANVVSMSFYASEDTFPSQTATKQLLDPTLKRASAAGITLVACSGDNGPTSWTADASGFFPFREAAWPADSPYVTALGGTAFAGENQNTGVFPATTPAQRAANPDTLWNVNATVAENSSTGAAISTVYNRPAWQNSVKKITGGAGRSYPDITMHGTDGTSEASPLFAGVVALAVQANHGKNLGNIDQALYSKLGPAGANDGLLDVVSGTNQLNPVVSSVPGFSAAPGYDVASGWGTVDDLSVFVPNLVKALK